MRMIICGLFTMAALLWFCRLLHQLRKDEAVEIPLEDIAG